MENEKEFLRIINGAKKQFNECVDCLVELDELINKCPDPDTMSNKQIGEHLDSAGRLMARFLDSWCSVSEDLEPVANTIESQLHIVNEYTALIKEVPDYEEEA